VLAQSQHVFIASKPKSFLLIFKFLTEFQQMSWRRYDRFTGAMSVPQRYPGITLRFTVTSVTSSPRLWSTTI